MIASMNLLFRIAFGSLGAVISFALVLFLGAIITPNSFGICAGPGAVGWILLGLGAALGGVSLGSRLGAKAFKTVCAAIAK